MKTSKDLLKTIKAKQRKDEIEYFGRSINWLKITKNKKKYTRKIKHKNHGMD